MSAKAGCRAVIRGKHTISCVRDAILPVLSPKIVGLASSENDSAINCGKSEEFCAMEICMGKTRLATREYRGLGSAGWQILTLKLQTSHNLWQNHFRLMQESGYRRTRMHKHIHVCRMCVDAWKGYARVKAWQLLAGVPVSWREIRDGDSPVLSP